MVKQWHKFSSQLLQRVWIIYLWYTNEDYAYSISSLVVFAWKLFATHPYANMHIQRLRYISYTCTSKSRMRSHAIAFRDYIKKKGWWNEVRNRSNLNTINIKLEAHIYKYSQHTLMQICTRRDCVIYKLPTSRSQTRLHATRFHSKE